MFGMDVLTQPQIDLIVLDFPTFLALGNGGAQSVDFWSENGHRFGAFAPQICQKALMNTSIGDGLFQDIPRRVKKFRENRPRDVQKSVDWKKHDQNITVFAMANVDGGRL